ncbi:hypothetical protein NDU88_009266 [Pleurodeles waltl]|uniref:Uncharacterized protein n=1 Tax=Pleurodeles waltl TaxID=8319 RepID=A0AAV7QVB5_PLEWA|nr:hypothetical protein NDU88_009266 [Pleurodeles waltl]
MPCSGPGKSSTQGGDRAGNFWPTAFVCSQQARVAEVRLPDGTLINQEALILQQFKRFYSALYAVEELDSQDTDDYLDSTPLPWRPTADRDTMKKDITPEVVIGTIHCLQAGKAPGADGFRAEF